MRDGQPRCDPPLLSPRRFHAGRLAGGRVRGHAGRAAAGAARHGVLAGALQAGRGGEGVPATGPRQRVGGWVTHIYKYVKKELLFIVIHIFDRLLFIFKEKKRIDWI